MTESQIKAATEALRSRAQHGFLAMTVAEIDVEFSRATWALPTHSWVLRKFKLPFPTVASLSRIYGGEFVNLVTLALALCCAISITFGCSGPSAWASVWRTAMTAANAEQGLAVAS